MNPIAARIAHRRLATAAWQPLWQARGAEVSKTVHKVGESATWAVETFDEARMLYRMPAEPTNQKGLEKLADVVDSLRELMGEAALAYREVSELHRSLAVLQKR